MNSIGNHGCGPNAPTGRTAEYARRAKIDTIFKTKKSPEELRNMVTSPGGTTVAGLRILEEADMKGALKKAVMKAAARAREISEEFEGSL